MDTLNNVVRLRQPDEIDEPLTEVLRAGARRLLAQAVEMEAEAFLTAMQDVRLPVARARIRDRGATSPEERIRFSSTILPKWARRTRSPDALLPVLYLRGISTGDFQEALSALLGKDAPTLSPAVIARLTATWADEYARWQGRDLSARHHVYIWARLAEGFVRRSRMEGQDEGTESTCRPGWRSRPSACWC